MLAVNPMEASDKAEAMATLSDELAMVLQDRDVPQWAQERISYVGCKKIGTFGRIEDTQAEIRMWAKKDLMIDPAADPTNRTTIAAIVDAWGAAKRRLEKKDDLEADERASKCAKNPPQVGFCPHEDCILQETSQRSYHCGI